MRFSVEILSTIIIMAEIMDYLKYDYNNPLCKKPH